MTSTPRREREYTHIAAGTAVLERGRIKGERLVFDDPQAFGRALTDGVFLVDIPEDVNVGTGDAFSRQFHRGPSNPPYGRFRDVGSDAFGDPLLGFHRRANQTEQFLLERRFWHTHFPTGLIVLGEALTRLSRHILCTVLAHTGIPADDWPRATGNCSQNRGTYHLTFNHYRPNHLDLGLNPHKDDGFMTILRATTPGLEVDRHGKWEPVTPDVGCFVINFGLAMEILTAATRTPVTAIMHRVSRQTSERFSFAHFTSSTRTPGEDDSIYRYRPGTGLERVGSSRDLIDENYANSDAPEGRDAGDARA